MSHCIIPGCDRLLSDREAKRKDARTGEELGLCDSCLDEINGMLGGRSIPIADPEMVEWSRLDDPESFNVDPDIIELFDSDDV